MIMKDEYDFSRGEKNPYAHRLHSQLKKQITIKINNGTIDYFKARAEESGIPYQTLINLYLTDCARNNRKLKMEWK